jgi:hypothetical protein
VPDELPACLEHLGGVKDGRRRRAAAAGAGAWLARQHPTWAAFVAPDGDPAAAGRRATRPAARAGALRRDDPAAARALVEDARAGRTDHPSDRRSVRDKPVAGGRASSSSALDDRHKAVRTTATDLPRGTRRGIRATWPRVAAHSEPARARCSTKRSSPSR